MEGFARHSVGTRNPGDRLANVVRRAQISVASREIEPVNGTWPEIPSADIEVDYDIEWNLDSRIYQWGIRRRVHGSVRADRVFRGYR